MDSSPAYVLTLATGYVRCLSFTPFAPQSAEVDVTSLRCADETHRWTISQGRLWGSDPTEICTYIYIYNINISFQCAISTELVWFLKLVPPHENIGGHTGEDHWTSMGVGFCGSTRCSSGVSNIPAESRCFGHCRCRSRAAPLRMVM